MLVKSFVCLFAISLLVFATREQTLPMLGRWLDVGEQPVACDYVMLLNGDRDTRPFAVAELYQTKKAARVLITSMAGQRSKHEPVAHEVARSTLNRCGVPNADIEFVDSRCDNTFDEASTLATFMKQHPGKTFCVVTNTYHSRRSQWIFDRVLQDEMDRVHFVSAETDFYNASNWWKHEDGFVAYSAEFLKFTFYQFRYGNGFAWTTAAVAGLLASGWWLRRRSLLETASV